LTPGSCQIRPTTLRNKFIVEGDSRIKLRIKSSFADFHLSKRKPRETRTLLDDLSNATTAQWTKQLLEDPNGPMKLHLGCFFEDAVAAGCPSLFRKKHLAGYWTAADQSHCMR
jgi:hypothetical protein